MSESLILLRQQLIAAGEFFHQRGWVPATSSNFSARLTDAELLITSSGQHKGYLDEAGIFTDRFARAVTRYRQTSIG